MNIKNQILIRIKIVVGILLLFCVMIIWKVINIQFVDGHFWKNYADSLHILKRPIASERGTIFSEDGNILSASLPSYDIYIDFGAKQMRDNKGKLWKQKLDSLCMTFAQLFKDKTQVDYKAELAAGYKQKERFYLFKHNVNYQNVQKIKSLSFIQLAKNKYASGFIFEAKNKRVYPYGELGNRTIGFLRDSASWNLGLEKAYDSVLRGEEGYRLIKYLGGGSFAPIEGHHITANNGKDIITTLSTNIQEIAQTALKTKLKQQQAEWGTCIVMEVATGKIKAMVNLTSQKNDTDYVELINYAIKRYEPGSTFKLFSMLALLEDNLININDKVDLNRGQLEYGKGIVMYDSEKHDYKKTSVKNAFAMSSNVGVSRLVNYFYREHPERYLAHLRQIHFTTKTGFDLITEEASPNIPTPKTKYWSKVTSLPWISIGYGIEVTPLQTLNLYNAVANNGVMMKPYLVSQIMNQGLLVQEIQPSVVEKNICSPNTLEKLQFLLQYVVDSGTAKKVFRQSFYHVAGKTGTNLFYEKQRGYKDSTYMSSFVGYFPVENPRYSCIVVIKNKSKALNYYGASVAAPVFKNVADRLMAIENTQALQTDISEETKIEEDPSTYRNKQKSFPAYTFFSTNHNLLMPNLIGMNVIKALEVIEKLGLRIQLSGTGIVVQQTIPAGTKIQKGNLVTIILG